MTIRSIESHVQGLINRRVAEAKIEGSNSPDLEIRALIESIALNLLLNPKTILYFAHLARNALANTVNKELIAIDDLISLIEDLANTTYTIVEATHLNKARNALIQIEGLEKVDVNSSAFKKFDKAIDDFLNKSLAKSVRTIGSTDLKRSNTEALEDLPTNLATLVSIHEEMIDRLYALSVGVDNFSSSSLSTILGLSTVNRAKDDIEDIIDIIDTGESGSQSRDMAIRVLSDRAALKSIGSLPSIFSPLIDTVNSKPIGYVMKARSDPATVSVIGNEGPYVFDPGASASITVNGTTLVQSNFPQSDMDLENQAFIASTSDITFPVTIPSGSHLFIHLIRLTASTGFDLQADGTYIRAVDVPFTAGPISLAQVLSDINAELGSDGTAIEYIGAGTNRIMIIGYDPIVSVSIAGSFQEPGISAGTIVVSIDSAHNFLKFIIGQKGESGSTSTSIVKDSLNHLFGSIIVSSETDDHEIVITTIADVIGTNITISTSAALGVSGNYFAKSNNLKLYGTVFGKSIDPIDPTPLVDISDIIETPNGSSIISNFTTERLILQDSINTFDGDIKILSSLDEAFEAFNNEIQAFLPLWLETSFSNDLNVLDRAIASLNSKSASASRNTVIAILNDIKDNLVDLKDALVTGQLPVGAASDEKKIADGIIASLIERRLDKGLDLILRLKIQEFFELTGENASYGGDLLKAMADMAKTDVIFPNTAIEDGSGFKAKIEEPEA